MKYTASELRNKRFALLRRVQRQADEKAELKVLNLLKNRSPFVLEADFERELEKEKKKNQTRLKQMEKRFNVFRW